LRRGESLQNRQLQTWLTEWDTKKLFREKLIDKPSELKRYEDNLEEAIMMRNRSDALHELRNSKGFQQMEVSKAK